MKWMRRFHIIWTHGAFPRIWKESNRWKWMNSTEWIHPRFSPLAISPTWFTHHFTHFGWLALTYDGTLWFAEVQSGVNLAIIWVIGSYYYLLSLQTIPSSKNRFRENFCSVMLYLACDLGLLAESHMLSLAFMKLFSHTCTITMGSPYKDIVSTVKPRMSAPGLKA